jgi:polyisoprenoid-binding protein YceI
MKTRFKFLSLCAALFVGFHQAAFAASTTYTLSDANGKNQILFASPSPAEYIEGTATGLTGTITLDPSKPNLDLRVIAAVPVDKMRTGNDIRDEHLRSDVWLNAGRYPGIRFELDPESTTVTKKSDRMWVVNGQGMFTMKGISKPVTVPVVIKQDEKSISVAGRFTVRLEDHGVHGPIGIKMIGVKVSPDVQINLNLKGSVDPGWGNVRKKK